MVRSRMWRGPDGPSARPRPVGRSPFVAPRWLGDEQRAVTLLSTILGSPTECCLFATDPEGTIMLWSLGASRLYGYEAPAVLGKLSWWDVCTTGRETAGQQRAPLDAALREGGWTGTVTRTRGGGDRLTVKVVITPLRDEDGRPAGFLTSSRDISAQLREVEELEQASASARALFEANVVPLATADPLGVITDVNHPAELLTGRSRDELVGTQVTQYAAETERAQAALRDVVREGRLTGQEFTVRRPDDSTVDVLLSASAVTDRDGKLYALLATILDLTEHRQLREHLQRSEAYYRGLIEAAADGLVTVDAAGFVTDVTSQVCRLSGYDREELVGSEFAACFRDSDQARHLVDRALAGRPARDVELHLVASDDSVKRVWVSTQVFPDPLDSGVRLVASLRDVTEAAGLRDRLAHERAYNRSIIEASANGLVISDLRHRITDVNGTMCQLTRRPRDELIGTELTDCFADPDAATDAVHRALLTGEVTNCELTLATPGLTVVLVNISILRDDDGEAAGLLVSIRDVSEQARLRHDLATQQAYTRAIVESSVVALFTIGQDGTITDANAEACSFTGYSRHCLLGRRFSSLFADPCAAQGGITLAFSEGHVDFLELALAPAGRPAVAAGLYAGMFLDPRTQQKALIAAVRDITAEKATEDELHVYTQFLYGATTDALVLTDPVGVITDVNHSMEELTGRTRQELIGQAVETCFTERDRAHDFVAAVLREGRVAEVELTVRRPDGGSTVLWYSAATFCDKRGKLQGIFASARDITARKKFEELQASMLERAQDLDRAKSDFVSRISHELRSPLTSVLGYLELLGEGDPGPLTREQQRMLEVMGRNGRRLLALIEDLLLLSRIEAGTVTVTYEPVRMEPIIRNVCDSFEHAISTAHLNVRLDVQPGVELNGDPAQLQRLVANLVSNAVKFTPPGGEVDILCHRDADEVIVQVHDTGIGVPEDEQARLFTRFFRSSISMERETQGTGLGLFIVKHVAEAHGGMVGAVSAPGIGSTFTVRLPSRRRSRRGSRDREAVA
jgi:PAS domain S-box-containing protein